MASTAGLEAMALFFPLLLQNVTRVAENTYMGPGSEVKPLILHGLLVAAFIIGMFGMNFLSEWTGTIYADRYQGNVRFELYKKFARMTGDQIDQIGVARILPTIMTDSNWLRVYHRRKIQMLVYFPIAVVGSFVMLFYLGWVYALFALGSIPLCIGFFWISTHRMKKLIPASVDAFDGFFINIKEGLRGAKDIRLLGKADERAAEYAEYVRQNKGQTLQRDKALAYSTGFNAILFALITIGIILYASLRGLSVGQTQGVVALNTAVQYINRIWASSHLMFTWFNEYIPRCRFTYKRHDEFYSMPDQIGDSGFERINVGENNVFKFDGVNFMRSTGRMDVEDINITVEQGKCVAIAGGIGSGKSAVAELLIKKIAPTGGAITFNDVNLNDINTTVWRHDIMSICNNAPQFIPGTMRDNFRLLAPNVTDQEIIDTFIELGATDFIKKFDNFLDFHLGENFPLGDSARNLISIVRGILKPANIYVFNRCFEHVKPQYIARLAAKLKKEKRMVIFITYNSAVCENSDIVYALANGHVTGVGTHRELLKSNKDYRALAASTIGVMVYEAESDPEAKAEKVEVANEV